jgi:hypothetical protein
MLSTQQGKGSPYPAALAEWMELDYHERLRPLCGWRKWATLSGCALAAAAIVWSALPGKRRAHQAGPLATAHAAFNDDCSKCHTESLTPLARLVRGDSARSVPNGACLVCHDGAPHHAGVAPDPDCAACHREHLGKPELARVAKGHCTACHDDLQRFHGKGGFEDVKGFAIDEHPEFRAARAGARDDARLRFNHAVHWGLDLKVLKEKGAPGLEGFGDRLACDSCHRPDAARRYMKPINYDDHCASCHPLWVPLAGRFADPKPAAAAVAFRRTPAPHKAPEVVRAVLRERYLEFARANPVALGEATGPEPERPLPGPGRRPRPLTEAEWLWVKGQAAAAEERLFADAQLPGAEAWLFDRGAGCRHCHLPADPGRMGNGLPRYEPTKVPDRWFRHSTFRHDRHRMVGCVECHPNAPTSEATRDVLLPGLAVCVRCHNGSGAGARSDCAECHTYHDRTRERGFNGRLTIGDFLPGR